MHSLQAYLEMKALSLRFMLHSLKCVIVCTDMLYWVVCTDMLYWVNLHSDKETCSPSIDTLQNQRKHLALLFCISTLKNLQKFSAPVLYQFT